MSLGSIITAVTLERTLSGVLAHVYGEALVIHTGEVTLFAPKWSDLEMFGHDMFLQGTSISTGILTLCALVWSLSSVLPHVHSHIIFFVCLVVTLRTHHWIQLIHMHWTLTVQLQLGC